MPSGSDQQDYDDDKIGQWVRAILAIMTVVMFFGYIGYVTVIFHSLEFVNLAVGWIGGAAMTVMGFYFTGQIGSKRKFFDRRTPQPPEPDDVRREDIQVPNP